MDFNFKKASGSLSKNSIAGGGDVRDTIAPYTVKWRTVNLRALKTPCAYNGGREN